MLSFWNWKKQESLNTLYNPYKAPILWPPDAKNWLTGKDPDAEKRPWCWERLKAGKEGDCRGWDSWVTPPTQWTWVWVSSRSRWWTGKPPVLQSMGCKELDTTDWLNWTECLVSNWKLRNFSDLNEGILQEGGIIPEILLSNFYPKSIGSSHTNNNMYWC